MAAVNDEYTRGYKQGYHDGTINRQREANRPQTPFYEGWQDGFVAARNDAANRSFPESHNMIDSLLED